jgi:ATP-dependent Clp protease ATP-binding subunit ClpA
MILRVHPCNTISDKHDFAQLVGAPAGTVGSDDTTGILIDFAAKLQEKEKDPTVYISGIFVFEEVDKVAYDQFMVQLMEIFDSGVVHSAQ